MLEQAQVSKKLMGEECALSFPEVFSYSLCQPHVCEVFKKS